MSRQVETTMRIELEQFTHSLERNKDRGFNSRSLRNPVKVVKHETEVRERNK